MINAHEQYQSEIEQNVHCAMKASAALSVAAPGPARPHQADSVVTFSRFLNEHTAMSAADGAMARTALECAVIQVCAGMKLGTHAGAANDVLSAASNWIKTGNSVLDVNESLVHEGRALRPSASASASDGFAPM